MKPEEKARQNIDHLLELAGWEVQDISEFSELYNVQHLTSNTLDPVSRVCITTIQRLYSMLRGEPEFDDEIEELNEVLVV